MLQRGKDDGWNACKYCLLLIASIAIVLGMKAKHSRTLRAIFGKPTSANIVFTDIEALVIALGGEVKEGEGSRVSLRMGAAVKHAHRPHPGKEAKKYQIEEILVWLKAQGIEP